MQNVADISRARYTAKHYDPSKHVSGEQLSQLLDVLRNSPSSVNTQPWHFVVIDNRTAADRILPAVAGFNHARITDSTYTVVFCIRSALTEDYLQHLLEKEDADGRYPNEQIKKEQDSGRHYFVGLNSSTPESQQNWASRQLYLAFGQFLFAAAAMGIDSTAIEGFDTAKADEILDLPKQGFKSIVMATVGFHSEQDANAGRPKSRVNAEELFTFVR